MDGFAAERFDFKDGAFPAALVLEGAAAIRASLGGGEDDDLVGFFRRDAPPSMAWMSWPRSAPWAGSSREGGIGFDWPFGRRSRRAEEAFPGAAFLITQARFEPSDFFPQAINLLLLFQAVRAITQVVETRSLSFGFFGALLTVKPQERRPDFRQQCFELAPVVQSFLEQRHQFGGNVHAAAAPFFGVGKDKSRMFISASASRAVRTDAGLVDFGQATFEGGPKGKELIVELLADLRIERGTVWHVFV